MLLNKPQKNESEDCTYASLKFKAHSAFTFLPSTSIYSVLLSIM